MVSSGSHKARFISPTVTLIIVGLIIGGLLGGALTLIFSAAPLLAKDGLMLLGLGIGQTLCALFGARLARAAMWQPLILGQALAIVGLLLAATMIIG